MISSILIFVLVLSVLILVHEFGHFLMARRSEIWVEEFGFGLPPRIWGKKVGETLYSINALPFGGFVRLHGETDEEGITDKKRAFLYRNKKIRVGVVLAGVIMNFLLGILCFSIVYSVAGIPKGVTPVKIVEVSDGSPAASAGLSTGDIITKINGHQLKDTQDFQNLIQKSKGNQMIFEVKTGEGEKISNKEIQVSANKSEVDGRYYVGVAIPSDVFYPPIWQRPFYGAYYGVIDAASWGRTILYGLKNLFVNLFRGVVPADVSGPVGIYAVTTEAAKFGVLTLINFVGILSVNLAILNIIPFPALDGGRLLFIGIEGVVGKKVIPKVEATIHTIGMVVLILLLLAITANDIRRVIAAGGINGFLNSIGK